ncbi:hypothetical protein HD806DRAFT_524223 [Xylariaceae sp. AK1471]|nr:hypothetical protein HD806DRAFT_524223 [Xylariaceae sp. AK1471]
MSSQATQRRSKTKSSVRGQDSSPLYAWVIAPAEEDIDIQSFLRFPLRICHATVKPSDGVYYESICTAGCALNVAGRLYVVAPPVPPVPSSAGEAEQQQRVKIRDSVLLGRVVSDIKRRDLMIIEVADIFRECESSIPIKDNWITRNPGDTLYCSANVVVMKTVDTRPGRQAGQSSSERVQQPHATANIALELRREPSDDSYNRSPKHWSWHPGIVQKLGHLRRRDAGSLVVSNDNAAIGIAHHVIIGPGFNVADSVPFNEEFLAYIANLSPASQSLGETQGQASDSRVWMCLERRHDAGQEKVEMAEPSKALKQ